MTKSWAAIQNYIRVAVSLDDCTVFRTNVGKVRTDTGRYFDTGLPQGHPDLYVFKHSNGKVFYLEIKNKNSEIEKRLSIGGYAETGPKGINTSAEGRSENRRVEIVILKTLDEQFEEKDASNNI